MSVLNNSGAVRGKRTRAKVGKNASDIAAFGKSCILEMYWSEDRSQFLIVRSSAPGLLPRGWTLSTSDRPWQLLKLILLLLQRPMDPLQLQLLLLQKRRRRRRERHRFTFRLVLCTWCTDKLDLFILITPFTSIILVGWSEFNFTLEKNILLVLQWFTLIYCRSQPLQIHLFPNINLLSTNNPLLRNLLILKLVPTPKIGTCLEKLAPSKLDACSN